MNAIRRYARGSAGASLLEVLVALSLLAVCLLGVAAAQLAALRDVGAQMRREHAMWLSASIAEGMRLPEGPSILFAYSRAQAAAVLRGGQVDIIDEAHGVSAIVVHWLEGSSPIGASCPQGDGQALSRCIAFPFVGDE
jgi:Tfp pilus assembly protein PilV